MLTEASNRLTNRMATVNFDLQTGEDDDGALEKACHNLKGYAFNENDLKFFFQQVELKMRKVGVKNSFTKLLVLTSILPERVIDEVKPILRKEEDEFEENQKPYKVLKDQIVKIFKPTQEAAYERAISRVLSGKPSQLARQIVNDLCEHELRGCCCKNFIVGVWKKSLPSSVKNAIASMEFNADNFDAICKIADDVYSATRSSAIPSVSAVMNPASGAVSLPGPAVLDQAFHPDFPQTQVAAMSYGRGRGGRGRGQNRGQRRGGGQGRGQGAQRGKGEIHPRHQTQRHADQPPIQACGRHWRFGKAAHFCEEPGSCPWKDFWVPKSNQ